MINSTLKVPSAIRSVGVFVWRTMLKIRSAPGQMVSDLVISIVSMLLFTFLFGGAIEGSPTEYVQFLFPGILYMTVLPLTVYSGAALSRDITTGLFDRLRILGFWQPSPIVGTLVGDMLRYIIAVCGVSITGVVIGFRPLGGIIGILLGLLLSILYAFCISWIFAAFGVTSKNPDNVIQTGFLFVYISIFCSNIFTDFATMPKWMQQVIKFNPTTHVTTATRLLMEGRFFTTEILITIVICLFLLLIFVPLTFILYNKRGKE